MLINNTEPQILLRSLAHKKAAANPFRMDTCELKSWQVVARGALMHVKTRLGAETLVDVSNAVLSGMFVGRARNLGGQLPLGVLA